MPVASYAVGAVQHPLAEQLLTWNTSSAPPLTITFSFQAKQSGDFHRVYEGWTAWSNEAQAAVRAQLAEYASVANIVFVEQSADAADPDIAFGYVNLQDSAGEAWWTASYTTDVAGSVTSRSLDAGVVFGNSYDLTSSGSITTILHEIGHALLNKHTGSYDHAGAAPPGPFLPAGEDNTNFTVMSYGRPASGIGAYQLQLYDIAAIQARFGANLTTSRGDDTYGFDLGMYAIWDAGGSDTIYAAYAPRPVQIDLQEGRFSSLGGEERISIAYGAVIEAAIGSAYNDTLFGNEADNLLNGGAGSDFIEGMGGFDIAVYDGLSTGFSWSAAGERSWTVRDLRTSGEDTLSGVESLQFLDAVVSLAASAPATPMQETAPAGQVLTSDQYADTLIGGAGADTLNAGQGPDQLTGGAAADLFVFQALPWNAGEIADFADGSDRIDLRALYAASRYAGADAVADGYVSFDSDGAGGARLWYDPDGPGAGQAWSYLITTLTGVGPQNLSNADLMGAASGGAAAAPSGGSTSAPAPAGSQNAAGRVLTSQSSGEALVGGAGADTLHASQGPDQLTGAGGADRFVFAKPPWNAGVITDFAATSDKIDVSALLDTYTGSNPIADGWLRLDEAGGSTKVYVDIDGAGGDWPFLITTLQGVAPSLVSLSDFVL